MLCPATHFQIPPFANKQDPNWRIFNMRNVEKIGRSDNNQPANDNTLAVHPKKGHISIAPPKKGCSPGRPFSFLRAFWSPSGVFSGGDMLRFVNGKLTNQCEGLFPLL
jgi:hypothetical protein